MIDNIRALSPEAWTALATWALVVGTLLAVWWQAKEQRVIHAYDLAMKLSERFNSTEMRKYRKELATMLSNNALPKEPNESSQQVLEFFDSVGLLVQKRVLDKVVAWNEFGFVVLRYHGALADRLVWVRERFKDETIHSEFDNLFDKLLEIERKKRSKPREQARPTKSDVEAFIKQEEALVIPPAGPHP
jgi:hypothetical protein